MINSVKGTLQGQNVTFTKINETEWQGTFVAPDKTSYFLPDKKYSIDLIAKNTDDFGKQHEKSDIAKVRVYESKNPYIHLTSNIYKDLYIIGEELEFYLYDDADGSCINIATLQLTVDGLEKNVTIEKRTNYYVCHYKNTEFADSYFHDLKINVKDFDENEQSKTLKLFGFYAKFDRISEFETWGIDDANRIERLTEYVNYACLFWGNSVQLVYNQWQEGIVPTFESVIKISNNVEHLRQSMMAYSDIQPSTPSINFLTVKNANDIEKILFDINEILKYFIPLDYSGIKYAM